MRKRAVQGLKYSVKWGSGGMHKEKNQLFLSKKGTFILGEILEGTAAPLAPPPRRRACSLHFGFTRNGHLHTVFLFNTLSATPF